MSVGVKKNTIYWLVSLKFPLGLKFVHVPTFNFQNSLYSSSFIFSFLTNVLQKNSGLDKQNLQQPVSRRVSVFQVG